MGERLMAKEKAFELDTEAAGYTGSEGVHFGDFPGVWAPGVPIALTELGFDTAADARAAVEELGLPLKEVSVDVGSAPMPTRPNHEDTAPVEPEAEPVVEPEPENGEATA